MTLGALLGADILGSGILGRNHNGALGSLARDKEQAPSRQGGDQDPRFEQSFG
jgi:hypothetical protein